MIGGYKFCSAFVFLIILFCSLSVDSYYLNSSQELIERNSEFRPWAAKSHRESKLFPLFTIIRFTNEICRTNNDEHGVCHTRSQCTKSGGIPSGTCAQGLGVCCQFITTCGGIINQNGTSFRNPNYPSKYSPVTGSDVCQARIRKQYNICQLRLNFVRFDIDGPAGFSTMLGQVNMMNDAGICKTDNLALTSSGGTVPPLCGIMSGQHAYVDFGSSDTITLNMLLSGNVQREREWNIEILMIPCNSRNLAPAGCLQYFHGVSGQVRSFNFEGGAHLARMDYSVCIRLEDGMRSIEWTACQPGEVKISGPLPIPPTPTIPPVCGNTIDYLTIMGGVSYPLPQAATGTNAPPLGASNTDRYCDLHFAYPNNLVRSYVKPFILHFFTDNMEIFTAGGAATPNEASQGFCLKWQQQPN